MLLAMEAAQEDSRLRCVQAKTAIAELAESVLRRICRVIGGGTFSRSSPVRVLVRGCPSVGLSASSLDPILRSPFCRLMRMANSPARRAAQLFVACGGAAFSIMPTRSDFPRSAKHWGKALFLRNPRLAPANEESRFEQGMGLRHAPVVNTQFIPG